MKHDLLLPCAGRSPVGRRPKWLLTTPQGDLFIRRAAATVPAHQIGRVIIGITADDDRIYGAAEAVRRAFATTPGLDVEIIVLDDPTDGPAETVRLMIDRAAVRGPIAIKDSDSFFKIISLPRCSFVAVCDLQANPDISQVSRKSFVLLNEQGLVSDIVEKEVCSNLISAGLYGFSDASLFVTCHDAVRAQGNITGLFVSHIIESAIGGGEVVIASSVAGFVDLDSEENWREYCQNHTTFVVDIDGVIVENQSRFFSPYWEDEARPIMPNVSRLLELQRRGTQLIFMSARPELYRDRTAALLHSVGFDVHALVMGCLHGRRYLINDFAASNPYPSAISINISRNSPTLEQLLP